ncbi:hypothetical protein P3X46_023000 [Hevea brasiliensis]|uniref:EF-hand domain-containing protein n=1 Tax=Hevea brasiliensis TaxID=3981 RepID=A0ABQ9LBH9_HEVBR|nr:sodium/calcium exchanger NCL [Hevea brasiliensis]KAJ9163321.1 hypothetical protein P3X46_023000 [Hevea brasiliensis]
MPAYKPHHHFFFLPILFPILVLVSTVHSRPISTAQPSDLISDGVHYSLRSPPYILLDPFSSEESCEQTYGFMPCTSTALGNVFLIIVYGYLMFLAATYLSTGSELLLEILGPGIVGGLFLPLLGAVPDAMLILASGLSGSTATAKSQVSVGMGLLAGSTIMILTVIWGSSIVVGKCDLRETDSVAINRQITKGFSLTGTGVSTDVWTCYAARIMVISLFPFVIVQFPELLNSTSGRHLAVLIALIISLLMLISYCLYQVFQPWIQRRRLAYAKHKHVIAGILKHLRERSMGRFLTDDGQPNRDVIEKFFYAIDENKDEKLSASELKALVLGIRLEDIDDLDRDDAVDKIMKGFDTSLDNSVDLDEFIHGISKWIEKAKRSVAAITDSGSRSQAFKFINDFHAKTKREHALLGPEDRVDDQSDENVEGVENPRWIYTKAVSLLLLGTIIAAVFADPLVDAVNNFSVATSIPSFFISFIALPLANSSDAVSAITFASRKTVRTASLTFSQLYGAVTMNNLLCLSVFMAIVYVRGLTWDFSSEVLVIFVVCIVMGSFASFRTTFPLWTASVAYLLYPFSLALVYVLVYILGWS